MAKKLAETPCPYCNGFSLRLGVQTSFDAAWGESPIECVICKKNVGTRDHDFGITFLDEVKSNERTVH